MTRRDRKELLKELVEVRALIGRTQHEMALLRADKDEREGATLISKESECAALLRREQQLVDMLSHAEEVKGRSDLVSIGSTVRVQIRGKEMEITISPNGDAAKGKITPEAPIAQALLAAREKKGTKEREGARVGDRVFADLPSGPVEMVVLEIRVEEEEAEKAE